MGDTVPQVFYFIYVHRSSFYLSHKPSTWISLRQWGRKDVSMAAKNRQKQHRHYIHPLLLCLSQLCCRPCCGAVVAQAYSQHPITRTDAPVPKYLSLRESEKTVKSVAKSPRQLACPHSSSFDTNVLAWERVRSSFRGRVPSTTSNIHAQSPSRCIMQFSSHRLNMRRGDFDM